MIKRKQKNLFPIFQIKLIVGLVVIIGVANGDVSELNEPCPPNFVGKPPNCRADPYLPIRDEIPVCPEGQYGYPPNNCHEPCPAHHVGIPPDCHPIRCPYGSEGEFQPNCTYHVCEPPKIGFYPHCFIAEPYIGCPDGQLGYPPNNCHDPCPAYRKLLIFLFLFKREYLRLDVKNSKKN